MNAKRGSMVKTGQPLRKESPTVLRSSVNLANRPATSYEYLKRAADTFERAEMDHDGCLRMSDELRHDLVLNLRQIGLFLEAEANK